MGSAGDMGMMAMSMVGPMMMQGMCTDEAAMAAAGGAGAGAASGWWSKYGLTQQPPPGVTEEYVKEVGPARVREMLQGRMASAGPLGTFITFAITDNIRYRIREARNVFSGINIGALQQTRQMEGATNKADGTKVSKN